MPESLNARTISRNLVQTVILDACVLGDATLGSYVDMLWAAKTDPDLARRLLTRFGREVDEARSLLAAAVEPEWWTTVTIDRLETACRAVRIWAEGDPICAELEGPFVSNLKHFFGIDIALIPRRHSTP